MRNLEKIRLIATDMDGTLLNSSHELDPRVFEYIDLFKKHGILFAAASGRQLYNLEKCFSSARQDMLFVAENGGFVKFGDQELHLQPLDRNRVREIIEIARTIPNSYLIFCGRKKAWVENDAPEFMNHMTRYFERYEVVRDLLEVDDDCLKVTVCDLGAGAAAGSYPYFSQFADEFQIKVSGDIWLDISDKNSNKGTALEFVQRHFGILPEETMVFGDYLNDVEMMRQAHFSFAMANARPEVKDAANFETLSNDEGGVQHILQLVADALETRRS